MIVATAFGLSRVLSGRAVYIHMGAMFGTIMAANVWMRILPAQRKMIEAIKNGQQPDQKLAAQAKLRSKQNTFMVVPVVFLMISNHYGGVTTGGYDWIHLAILIPVGWLAAKFLCRALLLSGRPDPVNYATSSIPGFPISKGKTARECLRRLSSYMMRSARAVTSSIEDSSAS